VADAGSLAELTTPTEPLLELSAQELNGTAANGRASLSDRLIMQMVAMVLKVVYLPFQNLLDLGAALGSAFKQLFQAPYYLPFLSMAQTM
jgi:hypothetical protein